MEHKRKIISLHYVDGYRAAWGDIGNGEIYYTKLNGFALVRNSPNCLDEVGIEPFQVFFDNTTMAAGASGALHFVLDHRDLRNADGDICLQIVPPGETWSDTVERQWAEWFQERFPNTNPFDE
jgi:hypothetical protein